jgi:hypothetical protein
VTRDRYENVNVLRYDQRRASVEFEQVRHFGAGNEHSGCSENRLDGSQRLEQDLAKLHPKNVAGPVRAASAAYFAQDCLSPTLRRSEASARALLGTRVCSLVAELSAAPPDIVELEADHLGGAEPKPREQQVDIGR